MSTSAEDHPRADLGRPGDGELPPPLTPKPGSYGDVPLVSGARRILGMKIKSRDRSFYFLAKAGASLSPRYSRRFPSTPAGWADAWTAFAAEDPAAARRHANQSDACATAEADIPDTAAGKGAQAPRTSGAAPSTSAGSSEELDPRHVVGGAAGAAALIAVLLWLMIGAWSLLLDCVMAAVVAAVGWALTPSGNGAVEEASGMDTSPPAPAASRSGAVTSAVRALTYVGASAPVVLGLILVIGSAAHHSSTGDVCQAWTDYVAQENQSLMSASTFDNAYFDAVDELGSTAADYGDDASVAAAGDELKRLADGTGDGIVVTIDMAQVREAAMPIASLCSTYPSG